MCPMSVLEISSKFAMSELSKHFTNSSTTSPIFETFSLPKAKRHKSQNVISKEDNNTDKDSEFDQADTTKTDRSDQDKCTVYVGNLPTDYTNKKLKKLFKDIGEVKSVRIRAVSTSKAKVPAHMVLKNRITSVNSLYGYVVFSDIKHTKTAVEKLNGCLIDNHHITVDSCDKTHKDSKSTVFVTNLHSNVAEEGLREFFSECGAITKVHIVSDRVTGSSKNFGFVTFQEKSGLVLALKKQGEELEGRNVVVRKANPKHQKLEGSKRTIHKTPKGVVKSKKHFSSKNQHKNKEKFASVTKSKFTEKRNREPKKPKKNKLTQTGNSKAFKKLKKNSKKHSKIVRNPLLPKKPRSKSKAKT